MMDHENRNKVKVELEEQFSRHRSERSGQKRITYSGLLKEKVRGVVDQGMSVNEVASACGVSLGTVRNWTLGKDRPLVKKLELDTTVADLGSDYAIVRINDRILVQVPAPAFTKELLSMAGQE